MTHGHAPVGAVPATWITVFDLPSSCQDRHAYDEIAPDARRARQ